MFIGGWETTLQRSYSRITDVVLESLLLIWMNFNAFSIILISNFEPLFFLLAHLRMLLFHSKITSKDLIKMKNISVATGCFSQETPSHLFL